VDRAAAGARDEVTAAGKFAVQASRGATNAATQVEWWCSGSGKA